MCWKVSWLTAAAEVEQEYVAVGVEPHSRVTDCIKSPSV
jgi:hypothetical protein